ncbi:ATP-binding protein [Sorangium sp. So ce321]|uniref:hybrid sensor histidine kinase/response regulator n=1 Tax=Sorangium sp. So ce321 TaxID=3133300 RepID=UPI003F5E9EC7
MTSRSVFRGRHALAGPVFALVLALARASSAADVAELGVPMIRSFGTDDGLPQSSVNAIALAPDGHLWIGTQGGAAYHDGQRFTVLPLPTAGSAAWVQSLAATQDGAVWFGLDSGEIFRYAGERFTRFGTAEGLEVGKHVSTIVETHEGGGRALWAGTQGGLYRFDDEKERFRRIELGPGFERTAAIAVREGKLPSGEPTLWVGTSAGLFHCEADHCKPFATTADGLPDPIVTALVATTGDGGRPELWAGTMNGLARHADGRWEQFTTTNSPLPAKEVLALAETVSGVGERTLWIGTYGGGLARLRGPAWTVMTKANSGMPDDHVMVLSPSGGAHGGRVLWLGTNTGGLARLRPDGWTAFTPRNSPLSGAVYGIAEVPSRDGTSEFWFGMDDGTVMRSSKQGFSPLAPPDALGGLTASITVVLASRREPGVVWLGDDSFHLHRWEDGRITTYHPRNSPMPRGNVSDVRESLDGRGLWVTTLGGGAARLDASGTWQGFRRENTQILDDRVTTVLETTRPDGKLITWFGTCQGLSRLEDGQWKSYTTTSAPLGGDFITALSELRDTHGARVLWIGTMGGGAARYDLDAEAWRPVLDSDSRPALPDDTIYQVRADARGRVYLFTNRGVARLTPRAPTQDDPAEFSLYTFTTEDGLPTNECNMNGSFVDSRGRIWVGAMSGAAVFDPAEEVADDTPKPLVLSAARAQGGARSLVSGARLAWNQNTVSFDYALLSLFRERDTRYRVQMVGFDPSPIEWTTDAKARYTNLSPGAYTFQVWGRDSTGNISGPASIAFRVEPAPWRTWWAYLGYAFALAGVVYVGVRLRLRALATRNRELEQQVELRTAELRAAKEAADAANRAKSAFLASMSHELRTPLNGILGYTQLVARTPGLPRESQAGLGVVQRSGEHLLALIDDVLDLARIEAGKLELVPGDVHLPLLLQSVVDLCRVRAEAKGLACHYLPADGAPAWVRADEKQLTQVLLNLLGNAVKFTREGSVTLRVEARGEELFFHVQDTGPGIAPADVARIFQPFEQSGDRRARAQGAGLGLSISRKIVEQMGGRIEVQSAPGEGSTFTVAVRLPAIAKRAQAAEERPSEIFTGYEGARRRVVVVDDNENNRAFLRDALGPLGFAVEEAEDGVGAIALCQEQRPDLLILDLALPDLRGEEVARRLRHLPALAGLPLVASSASVDEEQRMRAREAGCDEFLPKPVRLSELFEVLGRRLGLTWIRAPRTAVEATGAEAPAPRIEPPAEVRARLSDLADRGRIPELLQGLNALEAEDARLSSWVGEVRALAETYRLRELCAALAPPTQDQSRAGSPLNA